MIKMKPVYLITLFTVLALIFSGCSLTRSGISKNTPEKIDSPPAAVSKEGKGLYSQALKAQNKGQFDQAIKLWETFLAQNPNSHEGHNNLGLVYYTQDMLSQALQEFETAYRLEPVDPRISKNLARVLQFKANLFHENREYYKTLKILARLENIVPPEEKQSVLFKQEQVEDQIFIQVVKADNIEAYQDFIQRFPDGLNAVRAREFLGKKDPRKVAKAASKKKRSTKKRSSKKTEVTQVKSWISSGKKVSDPSGSPDISKSGTSQPVATYTPPPAKTKQKEKVDIFGIDPSPEESITEEDLSASQGVSESSVAAVPFEEFDKPQRAKGDQAPADEPVAGKDNRAAGDTTGPARKEPEVTAASLDSSSDTEQAKAVAIPTEVDAPKPPQAPADNTEMKPAEQAQAVSPQSEDTPGPESTEEAQPEEPATALTQAEPAPQEQAQPEPMQPEPAQEMMAETPATGPSALETAGSEEDVESESEKMARIIKEEIAKEEKAQAEPETESAGEKPAATETPAEEPEMEVASLSQEEPGTDQATAKEEKTPGTSSQAEPAAQEAAKPDPEPETVVAMEPSPEPGEEMEASPEVTESPVTSTQQDPSTVQMVVITVREGSTLNVRAEPSSTGEILGYLEGGDMMPFMKTSGDWHQIEIEEELSGWVHKKFSEIRTVTSEASLAPEPEEELAEEIESTESPVQAEPEESAAMVVITVREGSTLNVRSEPSPQGEVVDMLVRGDKVPLIEEKDGWYHVQVTDDDTGWVSKKFSAIEGGTTAGTQESAPEDKMAKKKTPAPPASESPVTTVIVIKVKPGSSLNVRSAPSSNSQVMGSLSSGDMRPLMKESGEWYQVELPDGTTGWVSSKFSGKIDVISNVIPGL